MTKSNKQKMTFSLKKDEDGYPPDDSESLWVESVGDGRYRIDNIPFFIQNISPDDIVEGYVNNGILFFTSLWKHSNSSVIRVVFFDSGHSQRVLDALVELGCRWEGSHLRNLFSVEIPRPENLEDVVKLLIYESERNILDYEESSIRDN